MKFIAFHLPQYHCFPENEKWWGDGFTDWTNVKKATPLFDTHEQPVIPLDNNYYNLTNVDDLKWQAILAKENGISGFCFYHYWFDGKLLMESPLKLILDNNDVDIDFCLCWANEPWTRAWDGNTSEILINQKYGSEFEWKQHIDYLLPYFCDARYIKINNMPVFVLYRTESIPNCDDMIDYWNKKCIEKGFNGIWIIEELNGFQKVAVCQKSKAVLEFQPNYIQKEKNKIEHKLDSLFSKLWCLKHKTATTLKIYDYDRVWKKIIRHKKKNHGKQYYYGAFVNWDNSPRKNKGATVYLGFTIKKFHKNLLTLVKKVKADKESGDLVFINAWNEWAEGAYLEPDTKQKYNYLQVVKEVEELINGR